LDTANKVLVTAQGRKFHYSGKDLHTQFGFIPKDAIDKAKPGDTLKTNTGKEMTVMEASFLDAYKRIKRGAQIIPLKDLGKVIAETGIGKGSVVLDAGGGSGATTCFLAHYAKKVYTYEVREDFHKIVEHNIRFMGLKNVALKRADIYEGVKEKRLDLMMLDLPEPWKVLPYIGALKVGGFLVSYSPTIPQVSDFVEAVRKESRLLYLKATETIEREWEVEGRKVRPMSQAIGHSGFLVFCRRVS
jgi:tRNA (adenine57-N1/adenine58-N1)-methyltransferase catalytic subunit